ncbi:hypothetical protein HanRHA438_Chr03g0143781 [Helianthus annuus]|nr:hypothetical protein HanRHA438_Chr03g0143781 [Helianthus annuus]
MIGCNDYLSYVTRNTLPQLAGCDSMGVGPGPSRVGDGPNTVPPPTVSVLSVRR